MYIIQIYPQEGRFLVSITELVLYNDSKFAELNAFKNTSKT